MTRSSFKWAMSVVAIAVVAGCAGSAAEPFDPLPNGSVPDVGAELSTVIAGQVATTSGPTWTLGANVDCAVLTVGDASSDCLQLGHLDGGATAWIGGVHGDVSVAVISTGGEATSVRFVTADGTVIVEPPVELGRESPALFVAVQPATNEIVGAELLDVNGDVLVAASIGDR